MAETIYKILRPAEWSAAQEQGTLTGSPADIQDGYIHFSTALQVRETAARHFSGEPALVLLAVDPKLLGADLRWEPSRGGELFPHLYAVLPLAWIVAIYSLLLGPEGVHEFAAAGI